MDLWIRSQQKTTLVKVKHLNIRYDLNDYACIVANQKKPNTFTLIGQYKSKERALEVLDEIQKFLQPDFKCDGYETETGNNCFNTIKLHFSEPNIFHKRIYEMPKE